MADSKWGSIEAVVNGDLIGVPADASYISVILMWLLLLLNLIQGLLGGLIKPVFVFFSIGSAHLCCTTKYGSAIGSVLAGRPCLMAWTWWRYVLCALVALVANGKSRLALFMWEWEAFGKGSWWWHGEGVWCWSYADCQRILKADQVRKVAFGAIKACVPDLYPKNLLIFLPSGAGTQWASIRSLVHELFLDNGTETYAARMAELPQKLSGDWASPKLEHLSDFVRVQTSVSKCLFFMLFGKWVTDDEATMLTGWRTNAKFWILPRMVHRFLFNIGIGKVKALRVKTIRLIEKYNLQEVFVGMNDRLPAEYRRADVVELCDEVMFAIGFAGIGGTCAAVESVGAFLQCKIPAESAAKHIKWGDYGTSAKMVAKYRANPETYIRETLRMDPPVTSATNVLKEPTTVKLNGRDFDMPAGMLNQYVHSMANRDESVFPDPDTFNPDRGNLNEALTWNGAFGASDEASYPRICPGRYLSMDLTRTIVGHVLGANEASA
mmetsp:Transcript_47053/g.132356  ORF Transcript_47053/g.132356 Transcript_47053/m.132356 type:complete len:494 (-) Transcript_47053:112-1593(-)